MKIYIRGGAWSNVEDQVLLAAYMKYGGNQWMRIASLLPKKSAAQVKARWEEYLDPTLRKAPWTPKEDQKLLHLAGLMPMQWRTIAQYFGRSAYQCVERYRELIDKASGTPHIPDNEAAVAHEMMPNFETWEAVPDPVEMDQESKDMLAEARARLSNTQGKKARRKARERQLDILRKVTAMKKTRELEAAGLVIEKKNLWEDEEKEIDPIVTHAPREGRYDTKDDDLRREKVKKIKQKIAEKKRSKRNQLEEMKDQLRQEESKLDQPVIITPTELTLPEPQISESELKDIQFLRHVNDIMSTSHELSLIKFSRGETRNPEAPIREFDSSPVKRGTPRPFPVSISPLLEDFENQAEQLVMQECMVLALRDAKERPTGKRSSALMPPDPVLESQLTKFENVPNSLMKKAEMMIAEEMGDTKIDYDEFAAVWEQCHQNVDDINLNEAITRRKERVAVLEERLRKRNKPGIATVGSLIQELNELNMRTYELRRDLEMNKRFDQLEESTLEARINEKVESVRKLEKEYRDLSQQILAVRKHRV